MNTSLHNFNLFKTTLESFPNQDALTIEALEDMTASIYPVMTNENLDEFQRNYILLDFFCDRNLPEHTEIFKLKVKMKDEMIQYLLDIVMYGSHNSD